MFDLFFIALIVAFFAATLGLVWLCQALLGGKP